MKTAMEGKGEESSRVGRHTFERSRVKALFPASRDHDRVNFCWLGFATSTLWQVFTLTLTCIPPTSESTF